MIFGFYPKNSFPSNISGPGIMGENGGHYYNGKWNLGNISADKLQQIISLSINYSLSDYGLAYNNCADFTLGILSIVGIANSSNGIDGPNTILDLMPASAKTNSGNAPQSHRTCN
ncbi:hypothetical protein DU508_18930 [Pedobacter chinensis]|uniref:DUF4105 domain-containing protein n=1 Tax=Pedobacter chinensis TaxID=2282421 RepID=A0A369PQQ9_9SPHI|nr:hypothetical protein [Pedobacter chinensis]RDC54893.1 hypothetical protein DU508_18930 [Pedobacter chinensis]